MPGIFHGWLLVEDSQGNAYEVINQARTAAYLKAPALALNEVSICDVLDFGGCATYALGPDEVVVSGGYIDFPGTPSGNYGQIPSGAVTANTGDMTVIVAVAADDWSPAASQMIVSRWGGAGNRGWALSMTTTGTLTWSWSNDGVATLSAVSTANLSAVPNGAKRWVAVTFDVDNGAAGRSVRFWSSTDGIAYTQLGTTVTTGTVTSIFATTYPLQIAAPAITSAAFAGNVYEVVVRNSIGALGVIGTTNEVFRFDANTDLVGFSQTTSSPVIVTSSGDPMTIAQNSTPKSTPTPAVTSCNLVPLTFVSPAADPAPWYNSRYPESADALGFYVNEWSGLDDGHVRRDTSPRSTYGGGAVLGVVGAEGRTMAMNLMLFARSEAGMDYLFRWLASTLNGVCATCATNSILIRRYCGSTSDPWNGVVELRDVGVIVGLKWESDVGNRARCFIRRASVTLMAGDPCMYLPTTTPATHGDDHTGSLTAFFTTTPPDDQRAICRPMCHEVTTAARTTRTFTVAPMAAIAPVVTWTNRSTTNPTFPFRAVVYADPAEVGVDDPCGLPILGELYVRALPPSSSMRWDVTGRDVEFYDSTTGGWTPSWTYVDVNDPPYRRFFAVPCGTAHLVMEPATMCATVTGPDKLTLDGVEFNPPVYPTVDVVLSERISCP